MKPENQAQHKIPQVYLKKFGYLAENNQWKVTVLKKGEKFTRQKSIEGFTIVTNIFDIESDDPRIPRIFEEINGELENEYNNIIGDLETNRTLTDKSCAFILQITANLICRSDLWRKWVLGILNHKNKENFLKIITGHFLKSDEEFNKIEQQPFYKILVESLPEKIINRVLLYFYDHLWLRLQHYEIVIIESQEGKPWFTSDNPIVLQNRTKKWEFLAKESEIYFPLSPKYLAYMHYPDSEDKQNNLRTYKSNQVHPASDNQNSGFQKMIIRNCLEYVIVAGKFKYRKD